MQFEIEEYITSDSWYLTCKAPGCSWAGYAERTENFPQEMHEALEAHKLAHPEIAPETEAVVKNLAEDLRGMGIFRITYDYTSKTKIAEVWFEGGSEGRYMVNVSMEA